MVALFKNNLFIKQASILAGGTALAQIINIGILPLLTRLYSPADFGLFAVMTASAALGIVFVTLRYENAILAVDDAIEAKLGMYSILVLSLFMSLLGFILYSVVSFILGLTNEYYLIGLIAIAFSLVSSWNQAFYFYCNRKSDYNKMTRGRIFGAITFALVSILWGIYFESFWGLLLGSLAGILTNLLYLLSVNREVTLIDCISNKNKMLNFYIDNRRFPKYLVLSSIIDRSGSQGYLILFTKVFGESVTGALSLYNKVAGLPSVLIGAAIGDVFKRNASEQLRSFGECFRLFKKTAMTLCLIAIPPFLVLVLLGPFIFSLVFGDQWRIAGEFAQILSPVFFIGFVVSPLSSLIYLEENQKYDLLLQIVLIFLLGVTLPLAILYSDAYMAVTAYATSYVIKYMVEIVICWKIANGKFKRIG